jgi:hypothetical protein
MPLRQYPNRAITLGPSAAGVQPPASVVANQQQVLGNINTGKARTPSSKFAQSLAMSARTGTPSAPKLNANSARPTINGWQNYTGKTTGPVGQFSRVPGFGRSFRG